MDLKKRLELLKKLEEDWKEIEKNRHEYPPEVFQEMEKEKRRFEFELKYGYHGHGFFESTVLEIEELRKLRAGGATLGEIVKKVVETIKEVSEQPQ